MEKQGRRTSRSPWRSLLKGCFGPGRDAGRKVRPAKSIKKHGRAAPAPEDQLSPNSKIKRLSFNDLSDPTGAGGMVSPEDLSVSLVGSNLFVFSYAELKAATQSYASANYLGEGGFGPVYKGYVDEKVKPGLRSQHVAVKLLDPEGSQGHKEWLSEVIFLGQLRHPNLVKLVGYCCEEHHRMLAYEYMEKGSLENHLFKKFGTTMSWATRMEIAVGTAKGLEFLHEAEKPVIYRDFKTSNILLDSDYKAKLSDFGLAKDGPEGDDTHVSTRVMGTHGYAAPEYIMTGHLTAKSDVYSFGVVLLELLTGRQAVDNNRPQREQNLVEWARPCLNDPRRLARLIDPALDGRYSAEGAAVAAAVAYQCLGQSPKSRPNMSAVVEKLEPVLALVDDVPREPFVYTVAPEAPTPGKKEGGRRHQYPTRSSPRRSPGRQAS